MTAVLNEVEWEAASVERVRALYPQVPPEYVLEALWGSRYPEDVRLPLLYHGGVVTCPALEQVLERHGMQVAWSLRPEHVRERRRLAALRALRELRP